MFEIHPFNQHFQVAYKVRIKDLGKLNLVTICNLQPRADFHYCPSCLKKMLLASKVFKINSKIIILRRESKSVTHSEQNRKSCNDLFQSHSKEQLNYCSSNLLWEKNFINFKPNQFSINNEKKWKIVILPNRERNFHLPWDSPQVT